MPAQPGSTTTTQPALEDLTHPCTRTRRPPAPVNGSTRTEHRPGGTAGNIWVLHFRRRTQPVRAGRCALAQR